MRITYLSLGMGMLLLWGGRAQTGQPHSCLNVPGDPACVARFQQELARPPVARPYDRVSLGGKNPVDRYVITAKAAQVDLGFRRLDGRPALTPIWGYDGLLPGPTIEARSNTPIVVKWVNGLLAPNGAAEPLPFAHLGNDPVGINHQLDGAQCKDGSMQCQEPYRMVVHFHGGHSVASSDGYANCAYDPLGGRGSMAMNGEPCQDTPGGSRQFIYSNRRQGTSLWYHDHGMGTTRYGVMAGLAGLYYTRDEYEDRLVARRWIPRNDDAVPARDREIPLVIMDRSFDENPASPTYGQMLYGTSEKYNTNVPLDPNDLPVKPSDQLMPEFFGKTILVNGTIWPKLTVAAQRYRFRILNGSNSRVYALKLMDASNPQGQVPQMTVIGTDGGLNPAFVKQELKNPALHPSVLIVAPGERYDVIVDFNGYGNHKFVLRNLAPAPFKGKLTVDLDEQGNPQNVAPDPQTTANVMQFVVFPNTGAGANDPTLRLNQKALGLFRQALPASRAAPTSPVRWLTLHETQVKDVENGGSRTALKLGADGLAHPFMDDPTEKVTIGSTETWRIVNLTPDTHPIHLHFVPFQVLERRRIDMKKFAALRNAEKIRVGEQAGAHTFIQPLLALRPESVVNTYESGLKDTVRVNPGEVVTIQVRFCAGFKSDGVNCAAYDPQTDRGFLGRYVWHCHILEHEDNEMMRPLEVVARR